MLVHLRGIHNILKGALASNWLSISIPRFSYFMPPRYITIVILILCA